jgi:hypothetical protein
MLGYLFCSDEFPCWIYDVYCLMMLFVCLIVISGIVVFGRILHDDDAKTMLLFVFVWFDDDEVEHFAAVINPHTFFPEIHMVVAVVYGLCCWMLHEAVPLPCYCLIWLEA